MDTCASHPYPNSFADRDRRHKAAVQKSRYIKFAFIDLPPTGRGEKNSPGRREDGTLRGTGPQREPMLAWVTPDTVIVNHFSATAVCRGVRKSQVRLTGTSIVASEPCLISLEL